MPTARALVAIARGLWKEAEDLIVGADSDLPKSLKPFALVLRSVCALYQGQASRGLASLEEALTQDLNLLVSPALSHTLVRFLACWCNLIEAFNRSDRFITRAEAIGNLDRWTKWTVG